MELTSREQQVFFSCFLFEGAGDEAARLFALAQIDRFPKGQVIYRAGHYQRSLGLVLSGKAVVRKENGVLLNQLGPGDCFGAASLFAADEFLTVVEAGSRSTVAFLSGEILAGAFARCPGAALNYISFLSRKIQLLNHKIDSFTTPSAQAALALWVLGHLAGGSAQVAGGYARLARELNMGRASLYRALEGLAAKGLVEKQDHLLLVPDPAALRLWAQGETQAQQEQSQE